MAGKVPTPESRTLAGIVLLGVCFLLPGAAQAQSSSSCAPWINASIWKGTVTIQGSGTATDSLGISTYKLNETDTIHFTFSPTATADTPCAGYWNWGANGSATDYLLNFNFEIDSRQGSLVCTFKESATNASSMLDPNVAFATLAMDFVHGNYFIDLGGLSTSDFQASYSPDCGALTPPSTAYAGYNCPASYNQIPPIPEPLPQGATAPVALSGTQQFKCRSSLDTNGEDITFNWTVEWNFAPAVDELEVVIDPQGYDQWRPEAGKDETTPGNTIDIQATLQYKSGKQLDRSAQKFVFQLAHVSAEPGITMNFPVNARPGNVDLQFTQDANPTLSIPSSLEADTQVPNLTQATATVTSFDWGAWGEIQVVAMMPDGTQIQGHLRNADTTSVLLPKRSPDSHIADVWKQANNVAGKPDDDDSETDPVGLDGCIGDGLTLYEEYRGFIENGKHIEGNPQNKDFFIQNLLGADAEPGIFLFTDLSQLSVHKDVQLDEMDGWLGSGQTGNRLINENHNEGAHVTDQHGVIIKSCIKMRLSDPYIDGGLTLPVDNSLQYLRFRPGRILGICMQYRDSPGHLLDPTATHGPKPLFWSPIFLTPPGVIRTVDAYLQFDAGVAHELLHSVGVDHHGPNIDLTTQTLSLVLPGDPSNSSELPVFRLEGNDIRLVDEQTGVDEAAAAWQKLKTTVSFCHLVLKASFLFPDWVVNGCRNLTRTTYSWQVWVGEPHGQHSGNDQCVMRYFFANLYPAGDGKTYYDVAAGTEPVGFNLCTSPVGTGVNGIDHKPQSRYSDASPNYGACQMMVCVNDSR